ncbi:MAG: enoyl-CoA hydratase [Sulfobacillus benefaciens]|uniref:Enoyl-CoA hydratase domain-containing protein 3, mitochondrial n=1 Tax=Sulfobacillus benefaciens TaxID=453960 RepID=A0A2T2XLK2_9FIRM|nr:MAG: enoyl-CoA hydratase [Sulfobacillus benefaciens]
MALAVVEHHDSERIAYITLNNPKRRNALSEALLAELEQHIRILSGFSDINVVIIKAEGPVFSSGHDLNEVLQGEPHQVHHLFQTCGATMRAIRESSQVVIAEVSGIATAAGCQLVAACDLAVAADTARFATPGVKIGLFCSTPAVHVSRNLGRKKAAEMLFTGAFMSARDAELYGLINYAVPEAILEAKTLELAHTIAQYSHETLTIGKRMLQKQWQMTDDEALDYATEVITLQSTHPDAKEGISAFLSKRTPVWPSQEQVLHDTK